MSRTTSELRTLWHPPCESAKTTMDLYGEGRVTVDNRIMQAVTALDACLERHSYETRREDTGAYNCRLITGGTNYSLHAYGIALDLNWQTNPYGPTLITDMPPAMVADIKAIRTNAGLPVWRWGGDYSGNKDAMHYEIIASPAELAAGIAPGGGTTQPPTTDGEFTVDAEAAKRFDKLEQQIASVGTALNKHIEQEDATQGRVDSVGTALNKHIEQLDEHDQDMKTLLS
jgi:hypothetical protein